MITNHSVLRGNHVRLEPLNLSHIAPLLEASSSSSNPGLYAVSFVPRCEAAVRQYVETALACAQDGHAVPFATVRQSDGAVIGSTRFFDLERWAWPKDHPQTNRFDTGEIGYTWLRADAMRTAANTEAKFLMLTLAFESWGMRSVSFHTDARNVHSRAALERIGAKFEGILRSHRLATDFSPRDSARYSIIANDWPNTKVHIAALMASA